MDKQKLSYLIKKYKKGECSSREKELLENFLESFQNNPDEWIEDEMGNQKDTEEKIFSGIIKNIKEKNDYIKSTFFSPALLKRAASIIFFIITGLGVLYLSGVFKHKAAHVVWYEGVTSSGEKSMLTLSDGSKITLNGESKLKYPDHFDNSIREVYLEGEGYFVVNHDNSRPFIVHSENLSTTVLGTIFNISAYPGNKTISVSLLEGMVKVSRSEKGKVNEIAVLKPKEVLLYNKENNISSFNMFDSVEAIGWKDNIYKFENEPLSEVLPRLERAFGVTFKITDKSILEQKITAKFEKNSLRTILEVIKNLTGLDYKIIKGSNDKIEVIFIRKLNN
ncbi:MAG TPA: FecR domain-containing protein [Ignavibacteriaceae bacterium]|nr:FecR domain-containing protein [Ignavibacteriaceae bacterium]